LLKATFPDWCSILMVGSPGIGTLEFNISLAKGYLEEGHTIVFVTADMNADDVLSLMRKFGIDVEGMLGKSLFMIDYHSSLLGSFSNEEHQRSDIRDVVDLEGIMFNIDSVTQKTGAPVKIFLYSLSTLFLYNQQNVVLKFFQISSSRIRSEYGTAFFTLHDGVHESTIVNHLIAIADGVIELKFDEDLKRRIRIRHMRGHATSSQWMPFEIKQLRPEEKKPLLEWR
jgi:KaiC/GvpD/RAD55 family RecA-like ATPase